MLWPKYSKYEYCYKFSNSKIRDFGTGRWGKLESYYTNVEYPGINLTL